MAHRRYWPILPRQRQLPDSSWLLFEISVRLQATLHGEPYHQSLPEITVCGARRSGDPAIRQRSAILQQRFPEICRRIRIQTRYVLPSLPAEQWVHREPSESRQEVSHQGKEIGSRPCSCPALSSHHADRREVEVTSGTTVRTTASGQPPTSSREKRRWSRPFQTSRCEGRTTEDLLWRACMRYTTESCCTKPACCDPKRKHKQVGTSDCEVYWPASICHCRDATRQDFAPKLNRHPSCSAEASSFRSSSFRTAADATSITRRSFAESLSSCCYSIQHSWSFQCSADPKWTYGKGARQTEPVRQLFF